MPGNWTFIVTLERRHLMEHPFYINIYMLSVQFCRNASRQHIKEVRNSNGESEKSDFPNAPLKTMSKYVMVDEAKKIGGTYD